MTSRKETLTAFEMICKGIVAVSIRCNGASTEDGVGFSKMDAQFGHGMAQAITEGRKLSPAMLKGMKSLAVKYRVQMTSYVPGFNSETVNEFDPNAELPNLPQKEKSSVWIDCMIERETEKAVLIVQGPRVKGWAPKKAILSPYLTGMPQDLNIESWVAREKGFVVKKLPTANPA